jgi:hypothetical protein
MNLPIAVQRPFSRLWWETYGSRAAEAAVIAPVMGNVRARPLAFDQPLPRVSA